ncbi:MAG: hypothetical protein IPN96_15020 [Anaerolineales bacterium]|nr:hypothetical protein [Anaerolineales bacterium]
MHFHKAKDCEGYPIFEPDESYRFIGSPSTFEKAGFQEQAWQNYGRKIVRLFSGNKEIQKTLVNI